jgi:opacity protein-like surface antigen
MMKTYLTAALCLVAASSRVHADDSEVDVRSFEYVDVVETTDGSVWKGVVVEQTPNVQYKIATSDGSLHVIKAADVVKMTKQKNKDYRAPVAAATSAGGGTAMQPNGVSSVYQASGPALPAPMAQSGLRLDPSFALVFPAGDLKGFNTSFSPDIRAGYEALFGNFGLGGGGLARFTYWQLPSGMGLDPNNAMWTLETHAYGRAALHISRAALYGGVSLGVDTNFVHDGPTNMSKTSVGFGMNLQTGVEIAASPTVAFKLGFDYHPGTDTIVDGAPQSVSFYSLLVGASLRM